MDEKTLLFSQRYANPNIKEQLMSNPIRTNHNMNRNKLRDLELSTAVAPSMFALLRRAVGLELLSPGVREVRYVDGRPLGSKPGPFETIVGLDIEADKSHALLVNVTEDVKYPEPGWSGDSRFRWDDELRCANTCSFPQACACYG